MTDIKKLTKSGEYRVEQSDGDQHGFQIIQGDDKVWICCCDYTDAISLVHHLKRLSAERSKLIERVDELEDKCKSQSTHLVSFQQESIGHRMWINDLQSGMYINCVYCGHRYGPKEDTPMAMADVLKEHISKCPKHPMSALTADLKLKTEALEFYADKNNIIEDVYMKLVKSTYDDSFKVSTLSQDNGETARQVLHPKP